MAMVGAATRAGSSVPLLFVEHQGINFFDLNRLLVGLQWGL
jgi:hypothetical protein